jgi:acetyl coenzyme A synthetase (ADP forming)-like protein
MLAPRSIAVIGASRRSNTMGHQILHNLLMYGYTGAAYPVNPTAHSIAGVRAYPTVASIGEPIDLGVIVVPHTHVQEVAEQCCDAGVKALVVISAGFREVGGAGNERERVLTELVRKRGVRMVGPNCMGVVNADPTVAMNATFATAFPPFGPAAFVSQSGALGLSILDRAREYGIGMSQFVSVGNKSDVSGNDLLLQWEHDPAVKVILMYVESFGNPRRFLEIASRITKTKPIIVVKSGRSAAGARAASSHTGALSASDIAVDSMLAQAGVFRAATIEELFDVAMAFGARSLPKSRRTAVLTNAGGPGILATDALAAANIDLAELSEATVKTLAAILPPEASIRNPLDMVASATPPSYAKALAALLADPNVDAVVPIFVPPYGVKQEDVADAIVTAARTELTKPILAVLMGREGLPAGRAELLTVGIPTYVFPESVARAIAALNRHVEWAALPAPAPQPLVVDHARAATIIEKAVRERRVQLTQLEALNVLEAYGVRTARAQVVADSSTLASAASTLGYPLVMKIVSPDIVHKTEVGGVVTGIKSDAELREAYDAMLKRVGQRAPNAKVAGVLLQQMVTGGRELIVGLTRDPGFGPLVMFGLGGVLVEALGDVVFRMAPIDTRQAHDMLGAIRGTKLLSELRGEPAVDREALADAIRRIAQLGNDFPQIIEMDANPLLASDARVVALDARVQVSGG